MRLVAEEVAPSGAIERRGLETGSASADVQPPAPPGPPRPPGELGDGEIVRGCLEGRTELFAELVRRYTNVVATYLDTRLRNRELADELLDSRG